MLCSTSALRRSSAGLRSGMQRVLVIAAVTLLLDQLSKWAILEAVVPPRGGIAITGFFNVVLTYNTGVSFGLFEGEAAWQPYFLIAVNLVVSLALLVWVRKQDGPLLIWAVGLVVGVGVGNAVDRFHQPGVGAFPEFPLARTPWPALHVASRAIVCGV